MGKEIQNFQFIFTGQQYLFLHGCEQAFDYLTEGLAYHHTLSQH